MKKYVFLLLMFISFSLMSCDLGLTDSDSSNTDTQDKDNVGTNNDSDNEKTQDKTTNSSDENQNNDEIIFTGLTVVDIDECSVKVTKIDPDNFWGYTLKIQLENKSNDKAYTFSLSASSINGVKCDAFLYEEVAPGKKVNEDIIFLTDVLEENGIKKYTDIELTFRVCDSNDLTSDDLVKKTVHIYPYGEAKVEKYVRKTLSSDNVIVDNQYVTVIVTGYENDPLLGYIANLFILNKSNINITFTVDDVSINGFMADPLFIEVVSSGKCAFSDISWFDSTLEENGITDVEEIEFTLRAYNYDNWFADDLVNEVIKLQP